MAVREMMLDEAPEAIESIYDAYNAVAIGFSFTGRLRDSFCHIATYARHVNLGFNRGASLPDPQKKLQGTGKAVRHIRIMRTTDLNAPYLRRYIQTAIAQVGGTPVQVSNAPKSVVRGNYPKKRRPAKLI